ncbi:MAG: hypothetical protein LBD72_02145 [Puniceicoccales bacterium]|jgi:hypothetical protein|nr:hypothetical protein [Puniceicoccales bacterium]
MGIFNPRYLTEADAGTYKTAQAAFDAARERFDGAFKKWISSNADKTVEDFLKAEGAGVDGKTPAALQKEVETAKAQLNEAAKKGGMSMGAGGVLGSVFASLLGLVAAWFMPTLFAFSSFVIPSVSALLGLMLGCLVQKYRFPFTAVQSEASGSNS